VKELLFPLLAVLAACTKTAEVFQVGGGAFEITADARVAGLATVREAAYKGAVAYCSQYRAKVSVLGFKDQPSATTLVFRCSASE